MAKNKTANANLLSDSSIHELARQLGVERRRFVRVNYPPNTLGGLPSIYFGEIPLRVQDISIGGLCLIDKYSVLGEKIGNDIELRQEWPDGQSFSVASRIVSRGAHRRNIQFMDLPDSARRHIETNIQPGICGLAMSVFSDFQGASGPVIAAVEIWHSAFGDSVVFHQDVQKIADISLMNRSFVLFNKAWPKLKADTSVDAPLNDVQAMTLFLANIPNPSANVLLALQTLEDILLGVGT